MSNVVYFNSSMTGAPALSQTLGSLITVLDACLVDGFGSVTLDSLVVSNGVATCTKSTGHNFAMIVTDVGPVIRIAGATPSGLNGDHRITVTSSTAFTFSTSVGNGTASGTITAKRAPAGWTKEFSGTNKAAYRGNTVTGSGWYFQVDGSSSTSGSSIYGYKTMSDVNTGTRVSLVGYVAIANNQAGNSDWQIIADDRTVWIRDTEVGTNSYQYFSGFGDFTPANPSDIDNAFVGGFVCLAMLPAAVSNQSTGPLGISSSRLTVCSGYSDQVSRGANAYYAFLNTTGQTGIVMPGGQDTVQAYPNAMTGLCDVSSIIVLESANPRGSLRGIFAPMHKYSNLPDATALALPSGHTGMKIKAETYSGSRYGAVIADLTGPW